MSRIIDELKRRATGQGLTVYRIAQLTGINKVTLYRIWSGKADPRISTVEKIMDALKLGVKKEPPPD